MLPVFKTPTTIHERHVSGGSKRNVQMKNKTKTKFGEKNTLYTNFKSFNNWPLLGGALYSDYKEGESILRLTGDKTCRLRDDNHSAMSRCW